MKKTRKSFYKIFIFVLIISAIFAGYFNYRSKFQLTKKSVVRQTVTVYFKIDGQKDFIKQEVSVGKTALELTKEKVNVVTKGEDVNAYVVEINGRSAEDSKKEFWAFYVNGKIAEVGAGSYILKEGDRVEWRIEKY